MVRNIFITNDNQDDISIYEKEPIYVVNFKRDDFKNLRRVEESQKPGIYILIGENRRYVGQASDAVFKRLDKHETIKNWWTSVLFFGRNDGLIDKSQLDYLERFYINSFSESGFDMDNKTGGNNSKIQKLNKIKADEIRTIFEEIIEDVANIDLYDNQVIEESLDDEMNYYVKIENKIFSNKSLRQVEIQFVAYLLKKYRKQLEDYIIEGKATAKNNLGRLPNQFPSGQIGTREIQPGIYLFVNQSKAQISYAIRKISKWLHLENKIEINF